MRLFCAIELPQEIREKLSAAQAELPNANLKKVEFENLHITLSFFGEVEEKNLQQLQDALLRVQFSPLSISIKGIGAFPGAHSPRVIFAKAECSRLAALAKSISAQVQSSHVPISPDEKPFHAHVTLARIKGKIEIAGFAEKYSDFAFGSFVAKEFALKKSELTGAGAKHETLLACNAHQVLR